LQKKVHQIVKCRLEIGQTDACGDHISHCRHSRLSPRKKALGCHQGQGVLNSESQIRYGISLGVNALLNAQHQIKGMTSHLPKTDSRQEHIFVGDIVDGVGIIDLNERDCRSNGTDNRVQLLHSPRAILGKFEAAERCEETA
jgi:hypothetical protein